MARIHRIGQTKNVLVLRLCTRDTIEKRMLDLAVGKRRLENLVVTKKQQSSDNNDNEEDGVGMLGSLSDDNLGSSLSLEGKIPASVLKSLLMVDENVRMEKETLSHNEEGNDGFITTVEALRSKVLNEVLPASSKAAGSKKNHRYSRSSSISVGLQFLPVHTPSV